MLTRRGFLKRSGLLASGLLSIPSFLKAYSERTNGYNYKPGLQLFTIRDAMDKDPKGSLERVSRMGYQLVESASYSSDGRVYGMDIKELKKNLKDNKLEIPSAHLGLGDSDKKGTILNIDYWKKAVEDSHKLGMQYMVCPLIHHDDRQTLDDYKRRSDDFNRAGEICKNAGIQFCYHNHNFEFSKIDGQVPYNILLNETDEDLVKMEMDIYWISFAGFDPVDMLKKHPGRFVLWHVKDMDSSPDHYYTEVGNGIIDWPKIFSHAKESGMKHFFVEQDRCPGDPFDSIQQSITYLKKNILAK